jgi:DNA-binding NarL/FixJ family response regulator
MRVEELTLREVQVLLAIGTGKTVHDIAEDLGVNFETVRFHVRKLRDKAGERRKTMLAIWAVQHQAELNRRLRRLNKA